MTQLLALQKRGPEMVTSTVLICAVDPAQRALARMSFHDPGWYVLECGFEDLAQVAKTVKVDAVVVIKDATAAGARKIHDAFASASSSVPHVLQVRRADDARNVVAAALKR